jgi:hypothetical protein
MGSIYQKNHRTKNLVLLSLGLYFCMHTYRHIVCLWIHRLTFRFIQSNWRNLFHFFESKLERRFVDNMLLLDFIISHVYVSFVSKYLMSFYGLTFYNVQYVYEEKKATSSSVVQPIVMINYIICIGSYYFLTWICKITLVCGTTNGMHYEGKRLRSNTNIV